MATPELDLSGEDTAIREAYEETGLTITKDQLKFLEISESDSKIHTIDACYLADISETHDALPELNSHDLGEIDEVYWIKAKNIEIIEVDNEPKCFYGGSEILPKYAKLIGHAMFDIRQDEINRAAGPSVTTTENLFAQMNALLVDEETIEGITGLTSEIHSESYLLELDNEAELRHQQILALARLYSERITGLKLFEFTPFTPDEIKGTIEPAIVNRTPSGHPLYIPPPAENPDNNGVGVTQTFPPP